MIMTINTDIDAIVAIADIDAIDAIADIDSIYVSY